MVPLLKLRENSATLASPKMVTFHLKRPQASLLLKEVYIDGELKPLDTTQWYPMLARKDYKVAVNVTETAVDDPDPTFYENYVCGAQRNYTGYCNPEVDKLIDQQSAESDVNKRKQLVWEI